MQPFVIPLQIWINLAVLVAAGLFVWIRLASAAGADGRRTDRPARERKLCGSTSTATRTEPRAFGPAASSARRKPCMSAPRRPCTSRRKRCRPASSASGASAGPSTSMSAEAGAARRRALAWLSASPRVCALTMMPASRPKGGNPALSRSAASRS